MSKDVFQATNVEEFGAIRGHCVNSGNVWPLFYQIGWMVRTD